MDGGVYGGLVCFAPGYSALRAGLRGDGLPAGSRCSLRGVLLRFCLAPLREQCDPVLSAVPPEQPEAKPRISSVRPIAATSETNHRDTMLDPIIIFVIETSLHQFRKLPGSCHEN